MDYCNVLLTNIIFNNIFNKTEGNKMNKIINIC